MRLTWRRCSLRYFAANTAVTVRSCDMSTTQPSDPVQAPFQPANVDAALGSATSRTDELLGYATAHTPDSAPLVMVQATRGDASGAVTVPEPASLACTRST